jgi:membrane protease subunit HflC
VSFCFEQDRNFFAFYRSLQAYRDALNGNTTWFVLNPSNHLFRFFENPDGTPIASGPRVEPRHAEPIRGNP